MSVEIQTDGGLRAGVPRRLFQSPLKTPSIGLHEYSVTGDGQRFLMKEGSDEATGVIVVVLNWHEELRRLVPTDR